MLDFLLLIIKKIKISNFLRNVNILSIGTIISQGIAILATPILSRMFSPNDYGLLALFSSVFLITANIVTLSYPIKIILPKKDLESEQIVLISIFLSVCVGSCLLLLTYTLPNSLISAIGLKNLGNWLSVSIIVGILLAIINTLNYWLNRNSLYKIIASLQIAQSIILTSFSLIMGFFSIENGLIFSQIFTFSILVIIFILFSGLRFNNYHFIGLNHIAKKHEDAPKYLYPANLLDVISLQLPFLLITIWFSQEMTGFYRMAYSFLNVPAAIVGSATAQIFYQRFNQIWPNAKMAKILLIKTWLMLFFFGLPLFLIIAIWGNKIFIFFLGANWGTAGHIASILAAMSLFSLLHSPTSTTFLVIGCERLLLIFSSVSIFHRIFSLYLGYLMNNLYFGLIIYMVFEIFSMLIFQYTAIKKINKKIQFNKS
jgi:O-antigen/teichoic acid export membrane protein